MNAQQGQTVVEYALLISLVLGAVAAMQTYAKRGVQAGIKVAADQLGDQATGMRYESGDRPSDQEMNPGSVLSRVSSTRTIANTKIETARVADQSETSGQEGGAVTDTLAASDNISETVGILDTHGISSCTETVSYHETQDEANGAGAYVPKCP